MIFRLPLGRCYVLLTRLFRIVPGLAALALFMAAVGDIALFGELRLMPRPTFVVLAGVVLLYFLNGFLEERRLREDSEKLRRQLQATVDDLQKSLAAADSINTRLSQSEARFRGLVDAQGDAIFRRAPDSRLTYGSDTFFKLFGLDPATVLDQPFAPEVHPANRGSMYGSFAELEKGSDRIRYDQQVRTIYGWRWMAWEDCAIRDRLGRLMEVQSVGRDITERKAMEAAMVEARDKAEAGSRAKSGFLATMSHEIRTPLNGVLGMARLMLETDLSPAQHSYVEAMAQSGETLLALIGDILDFSKIESGTLTLEEEETDPRALVEGVAELLGPRAHARAIELAAAIAPMVPATIRADRVRLRQVLTNLAGNAVKFTEKGGVFLLVEPSANPGELRFEVRDTGIGVPEDKRREIFDEFVQAETGHARKFGGTGLGLAISKRLVEAMSGKIGVEANPGGGSVFWFTVPARMATPAPNNTRLAGKRIAVISANPVLREALAEQIRAGGGDIAGMAGDSRKPDFALVDAGTGADSAVNPIPGVATLALLVPAAKPRLSELKDKGFAGYLVKPVRQSSLTERLCAGAGIQYPQAKKAAAAPRGAVSLKILLAEDNPINALLTRELLRRRGHSVVEAVDGILAVKMAAEEKFDLILTDIHMPGMDGIDAARTIRENEKKTGAPRVPVVALTADVLETGQKACREAGMDGFLAKPVDPKHLDAMFAAFFPEYFTAGDDAQDAVA
jgi:PAS domain S-box-containing protein